MNKRFRSLEEIAEELAVDYQLVYRLVRSGELPAVKVGRLYRVETKDFEAFLRRRKHGGGGFRCACCGEEWASEQSVGGLCTEGGCEEAICIDCWNRKGLRHCRAHAADATTNRTT